MIILGIETSCDETAAAVVRNGRKILSNVVASSQDLQKQWGGVVPEIAAREQVKCMIPVVEQTLKESQIKNPEKNIDAIAVTVGPGLIGSLLVGVETAKTLAFAWDKPIIPVNHIHAHIYANFIRKFKIQNSKFKISKEKIIFPAIALVASGGHTELFLMKDEKTLRWIDGTRDDAAGEAFDKIAKLLGLPYPGGPSVQRVAQECRIQNVECRIKLPRPMINSKDFAFSFSGLKTAVVREVEKLKKNQQLNHLVIQQLAHETQEAITDVLVTKTIAAAKSYKAKSIFLAGGVAANTRLREKFNQQLISYNLQLFIPPPPLCTDNAASIAACAYFHNKSVDWKTITTVPDLSVEKI